MLDEHVATYSQNHRPVAYNQSPERDFRLKSLSPEELFEQVLVRQPIGTFLRTFLDEPGRLHAGHVGFSVFHPACLIRLAGVWLQQTEITGIQFAAQNR